MLLNVYVTVNPKYDRPFVATHPPSKEMLDTEGTMSFRFALEVPCEDPRVVHPSTHSDRDVEQPAEVL